MSIMKYDLLSKVKNLEKNNFFVELYQWNVRFKQVYCNSVQANLLQFCSDQSGGTEKRCDQKAGTNVVNKSEGKATLVAQDYWFWGLVAPRFAD